MTTKFYLQSALSQAIFDYSGYCEVKDEYSKQVRATLLRYLREYKREHFDFLTQEQIKFLQEQGMWS